MQLYLIRHAQSESNARWAENPDTFSHIPDPGLTDLGRSQAAAAAELLKKKIEVPDGNPYDPWNHGGYGITHIYSSLMLRAMETSRHIGNQLGLPIHGRTDLHEWGGIYEKDSEKNERIGISGKNRQFFEENFPAVKLPDDFKDAGWWDRPFENPEEVPQRANRVLEWLIDRHRETPDRVLVVSHGGFLNHLISRVVNLGPDQVRKNLDQNLWLVLNNTGITRLEISIDFTGLVYHNRIDHLSPNLVT